MVADFLTVPFVAGFRVHQGEIVGKGTWEPILDEATWRALRAVIGARQYTRIRARRSYLLTGYRMFCECGKPMRARPSGEKYGYYACQTKVTDGCGKITIDAVAVEAHTAVQLFRYLEKLDAAGMLSADEHADRRGRLVNELQALDGRRAELSERWAARKITTEQFDIMNASVNADQHRAEAELSGLPAPIENIDPAELREAWPEMTLDEKRKIVNDWIEKIVVHPPAARTVTMDTVAGRAGVSQCTVWRAFHGKAGDDVVRRVKSAAEEVGYEFQAGRWPKQSADPGRAEIFWRR